MDYFTDPEKRRVLLAFLYDLMIGIGMMGICFILGVYITYIIIFGLNLIVYG